MTEVIAFAIAIFALASAILAALYVFVRDTPPRGHSSPIVGIAGLTSNKEPPRLSDLNDYDSNQASSFNPPGI